MAKIGANLCCLYDEAEEQKKFLSVITDAEWGIKLGKLEVMQQLYLKCILVLVDRFTYIYPMFFLRYLSNQCSVSDLR